MNIKSKNEKSINQMRIRILCTLFLTIMFNEYSVASDYEYDVSGVGDRLSFSELVQRNTFVGLQQGLENEILVVQSGLQNFSTIVQNGNYNYAELYQDGRRNRVNLYQIFDNNTSTVTQVGDSNIATVRQFGEQYFIVQQFGDNMMINITQY